MGIRVIVFCGTPSWPILLILELHRCVLQSFNCTLFSIKFIALGNDGIWASRVSKTREAPKSRISAYGGGGVLGPEVESLNHERSLVYSWAYRIKLSD